MLKVTYIEEDNMIEEMGQKTYKKGRTVVGGGPGEDDGEMGTGGTKNEFLIKRGQDYAKFNPMAFPVSRLIYIKQNIELL
jgi:hypothetical protein